MTVYLSEEEKNRIEAAQKLVQLLDKESDRGCCLLAVSFLDAISLPSGSMKYIGLFTL